MSPDTYMSPEETAAGINTLVTTIRRKLPDSKVLLLGIFPRGNRSDDPDRALIRRTNAMLAKLDDGGHVKYLDIGAKFLDADGSLPGTVMPDYLHLSARGYEIWATAIKPVVDELEE
jgi:beta-glucosidase